MFDLTNDRQRHADERLRAEHIVWLVSTRPDGRSHIVPVWFLWDGQSMLIFSQPKAQKLKNIRHNSFVCIALDDTKGGDEPIILEGTAEILPDGAESMQNAAYLAKYGEEIKQMGWDVEQTAAQFSTGIRFTPTKIASA